jgi:hypothetical protein
MGKEVVWELNSYRFHFMYLEKKLANKRNSYSNLRKKLKEEKKTKLDEGASGHYFLQVWHAKAFHEEEDEIAQYNEKFSKNFANRFLFGFFLEEVVLRKLLILLSFFFSFVHAFVSYFYLTRFF